jgi:hypothetical protein
VPYILVYKKRNTEIVVYRNESVNSVSNNPNTDLIDFIVHDKPDDIKSRKENR